MGLQFQGIKIILVFGLLVLSANVQSKLTETSSLLYIDWCPQICIEDKTMDGYIVEVFDLVSEQLDIDFKKEVVPWSRGIVDVNNGKALALAAPAKAEAPTLVYPKIPIGIQKMCFFVEASSTWRYVDTGSLMNRQIGVANETSIEELNDFRLSHPELFQAQPYHERFLEQNVGKLLKKRIDTFIFTRNSMLYYLDHSPYKGQIKEVGCVSSSPVYIAFSPHQSLKEISAAVSSAFDQQMIVIANNGKLDEVLSHYNVSFTSADLLNLR